ncbi:larval cuticle protein LCP-17 [Drosophila bipectinata]|uniref:larval cuticle protein LCP-17 n=1 Tax=Drosophila bipectinata TaxID=42026 RepID=UPI001C88FCBF|nr:larval cuticle protein LCP-17 [Drosophila bipectinata]KAH8233512.1 hypothetical protein KR026_009126 [Drosophila bipectinata]
MFKIAVCLFALASGALAASIGQISTTTEKREIVPLLKFETEKQPDGSFHFMYEGGDQSYRQEQGVVVDAGTEEEALEVSGSYRYIDADGNTVEVHYTAGKNGFVPVGTIIPSEITALAKAAADLPKVPEEEYKLRKGRSQDVEQEVAAAAPKEKEVVVEKEVPALKSDAVAAESQVVPVQVVLDAVPEAEVKPAVEAEKKVEEETKTA